MPWFCRPCAIEKQFSVFLNSINTLPLKIYVAGIDGDPLYKGRHSFIPLTDYGNKYISALFRRIVPDLVNQPDIYNYTLRKHAVNKLSKLIVNEGIDCIHSVSYPCSSHMIAYDLKQRTGLPWIAQLYDPWSDNIYRNFKTKKYRKKDLELEKRVADTADAIIHTNNIIKDVWRERYGNLIDEKSYVFPMGYDDRVLNMINLIPKRKIKDKVIVSYIGKLFHDRNIKDLINALNIISSRNRDVIENLKFRLIGSVDSISKKLIKENDYDDIFEMTGMLKQDELEQFYYDSDVFLVIDSPQKRNVYYPSKLLDYFIHQRLIIGISPLVSTTRDLLLESGNYCVENGDIEKLADILEDIVANPQLLDRYDANFYIRYLPENQRYQYEKLLESIRL